MLVSDKPDRDLTTGRFLTGNSGGGRQLGSRNKLSTQFVDDLYMVWQERGIQSLREMPDKDFAKLVAAVLPKELQAEIVSVSAHLFAEAKDHKEAYRIALEYLGAEPKMI